MPLSKESFLQSNSGRRPRRQPGFTLIEVLLASAIALVLGLVVVATLIQSTKSLSQVEGRVEMVQSARLIANRLQQIVSAGVSIPEKETVLYPGVFPIAFNINERGQNVLADDPKTWPRYFVFRTTEDFLATDFDPNQIYALSTMDPGVRKNLLDGYRTDAQPIYDYIVWWEDGVILNVLPKENKVLALGRLKTYDPDGDGNYEFRDPSLTVYPAFNIFDELVVDAATSKPQVRILGRNVEDVSFLRQDNAVLQVSVLDTKTVQAQVGSQQKEFRLDSLLQMPAEVTN